VTILNRVDILAATVAGVLVAVVMQDAHETASGLVGGTVFLVVILLRMDRRMRPNDEP